MHFNGLTPAEAERLALLLEELGETQQIIGKILRHGYESRNPHEPASPVNRELLITPEALKQIEERANAAAKGVWLYDSVDKELFNVIGGVPRVIADLKRNPGDEDQSLADGMLMSYARTDVPLMAAEIRALWARIAELEGK